jgi:glycosyltransferase involved in cell wall biosynthesis
MADTPQKILFVSLNHPAVRPGGAEGYALDVHRTLTDSDDFEPIFLARAGPPVSHNAQPHAGPPFAAVNRDPNQYFFYTDLDGFDWLNGRLYNRTVLTRFYRDFLLAHKPDIVHFQHTLFMGYDIIRVTRNALPRAAIVYTLHEYLPICHRNGQMVRTKANELCQEESPRRCNECFPTISQEAFFARKRFIQSHLSLVDYFITPTEYALERFVEWGIPRSKIQAEPYGYVAGDEPPLALSEDAYGSGRKRNRFGFFGQLTAFKGVDVLLNAMRMLGDDFDGHLWIYGANLDVQPKEFRDQVASLVEEVGDKVTVVGEYLPSEVGNVMAKIDWVVVPSIWSETGPLVVWEAFQYKRPVICSDIGGMAEKVIDGISGLHFSRNDPEGLAQVMLEAAGEPELWTKLSSRVPRPYSMSDHVDVLRAIYRKAAAMRQRADARSPLAKHSEYLARSREAFPEVVLSE